MREADARMLAALRRWSVVLDSAFRIPGTNIRFGLDPVLGLIPGMGDVTTPFFSAVLLLQAVRLRIPKKVRRKALAPGRYRLDLVVTGGGQRATDRATVRVRR